ncbi:hypothetical protein CBL_05637 [Carabus blaptoides fortunei]
MDPTSLLARLGTLVAETAHSIRGQCTPVIGPPGTPVTAHSGVWRMGGASVRKRQVTVAYAFCTRAEQREVRRSAVAHAHYARRVQQLIGEWPPRLIQSQTDA